MSNEILSKDVGKVFHPKSKRLEQLAKMWARYGNQPKDLDPMGAGEESVWSYPRPPALVVVHKNFVVSLHGVHLLTAKSAVKVMETASPPTYYFDLDALLCDYEISSKSSHCEWKGNAKYMSFILPRETLHDVGWYYENPYEEYQKIKGLVSLYPSKFDISINDEKVKAQAGDFYGGWVTSEIKGPFKGNSGTGAW
ncbi:MAG: DUF427 domain-containing protein [Oligoflexales bacterium]